MVSSSVNYADTVRAFSFSQVIDYVEQPFDDKVLERLRVKLPWL